MKIIDKYYRWRYKVKHESDIYRRLRNAFVRFYDNWDADYTFNSYRMTKIRFYNYPKSLIIEIHTLSPGMTIGKQGKCINSLQKYMVDAFKKEVKINLNETNPFK